MLIYGRGDRGARPACPGQRCAFIPLLSSTRPDTPTAVRTEISIGFDSLAQNSPVVLGSAVSSPLPSTSAAVVATVAVDVGAREVSPTVPLDAFVAIISSISISALSNILLNITALSLVECKCGSEPAASDPPCTSGVGTLLSTGGATGMLPGPGTLPASGTRIHPPLLTVDMSLRSCARLRMRSLATSRSKFCAVCARPAAEMKISAVGSGSDVSGGGGGVQKSKPALIAETTAVGYCRDNELGVRGVCRMISWASERRRSELSTRSSISAAVTG